MAAVFGEAQKFRIISTPFLGCKGRCFFARILSKFFARVIGTPLTDSAGGFRKEVAAFEALFLAAAAIDL